MNIILCIFDTLRYDYVGFNGNSWIQTPNIDRVAAQAMVFDRTFAASFPTIPHRTDVMTGKYGSPFHEWMPLPFSWPTLPRLLADNGYCTQLIHDTPHLVTGGHNFDYPFNAWTMIRGAEVDQSWIDKKTNLPPNFCHDPLYDELDTLGIGAGYISYFRANRKRKSNDDWNCARLFSTASDFVQDNKGRDNFFLWIDCFDPHEPFDAPPEYVRKYDKTPGYDGRIDPRQFNAHNTKGMSETLAETIINRIRACYAAKVSFADLCFGKVLSALEDTGMEKNTAIILTADHGTELNEYGCFGKGLPIKEQEGHIPLIVKLPDGPVGRSTMMVHPQDIFSTVLGIAGVSKPAGVTGVAGMDCYDLLAQNGSGEREIAVAGHSASNWDTLPFQYTVFDGQYCLRSALKIEDSVLTPMGSIENTAFEHPAVAERLHEAGLNEIERRGAIPELMAWLRSGGKKPFPKNLCLYDGCPKPFGYEHYLVHVYDKQE